jgi:rod shape-determining protein MreC
VLHLSIQARQALARLTLPILIALSCALILLGRADAPLAERARAAVDDALAPLWSLLAAPLAAVHQAAADGSALLHLHEEVGALRTENERLRRWYAIAMALDAENAALKAQLHWIPDPSLSFVTAHVVADMGGVYARSVLVAVGPNHAVRKGQIVLDADGLVGRVTEVGARSARVLLVTDINSRVPVMLEANRTHAMMVGGNTADPRLAYLPDGSQPREGERIVTSGDADAFPAGLPVGTVHYGPDGVLEVALSADLGRLDLVRIFDYGLASIKPPEAPGHPPVPAAFRH